MPISDIQVFAALFVALVVAILALRLGNALYSN
jgi:photosystem I reaction center subunit XII